MVKLSVILGNTPNEKNGNKVIAPVSFEVEGKDLSQAIGRAIYGANTHLSSQYDSPEVSISGEGFGTLELSPTQAKQCKGDFFTFKLNFPVIREAILAQLAFSTKETMTEYMRRTDRNGIYKSVKDGQFSELQVAAQAKEQVRLARDLSRWAKADAKDSVVPAEVAARRILLAEAAKAKRIAAKAQTAA